MKNILLLLLAPFLLHSQPNNVPASKAYFQQQADYDIEVELNDTTNELNGFITIRYTNHSPDALTFVYMHLWPNAYMDQNTPLAKQLLENGKTSFWYSKPWQRGYIDKLDFKLDAENCQWSFDSTTKEICKVYLNHPLKTGETVSISTPFHVKLPETFSRMGHVGQSYQITQWYPKPAVYDRYGWHPIPYLDQGEFYSEFGSYDVAITLPDNYVVGATGDLQDTDEINWLNSKAEAAKGIKEFDPDMRFPASSPHLKTIHYHQEKIHDFAWFADKRFFVLKGEVELPYSKSKVTTWSLFTPKNADLWLKAPQYLHDAIYYYSLWIGEYPYKQVTAVDGTISAGGGMEYPNITIIGDAGSDFELDDVITHEVGHNWFYGILGSNERDHAWMDEGINSYYEYRYLRTKYPNRQLIGKFPAGIAKAFDLAQYKHKYQMDLGYQLMARENYDQPIDIPSTEFTDANYALMVYGKSMLIFDYLEAYLGTKKFDKAMKKYFEQWQFKHPQPEDIRNVFSFVTKDSLNWFWEDLLNTNKKIDFKIGKEYPNWTEGTRKIKSTQKPLETEKPDQKKRSARLTQELIQDSTDNAHGQTIKYFHFKNLGEVDGPFPVSVLKGDSIIRTIWIPAYDRKAGQNHKRFRMDVSGGDRVQIDPLLKIPEINRKNNTYKLNKPAPLLEKLRLQFLTSIENQNRTQICWAPYLGWNNYDKTQVGLVFYNPFIPKQKFTYMLAPAFGTGSVQFIGMGRLAYNFYPEKSVQRFTVGIYGKRFSYLLFPKNLTFNKIEPYIDIEFQKKNARSVYSHYLHLRSVNVWLDWINFKNKKKETQRYFVNELKYRFERKTTLHPLNVTATLQQGNNFLGLWAEGNFTISYKRKNEGFFIRVFAGGFPVYFKGASDITAPLPRLYLSTVSNNTFAYWLQKDYMFDENFVDRNGRDKYLGRQVALSGGAFRSITTFGATSKFLAAANFSTTTHRFFPVYPFVSVGAVMNDFKKIDFAAELGLSVAIIRNMIEIHLPLVTTKNISDNQKVLGINKWYQKFTFTLKLQMQKPIDLIRRFI